MTSSAPFPEKAYIQTPNGCYFPYTSLLYIQTGFAVFANGARVDLAQDATALAAQWGLVRLGALSVNPLRLTAIQGEPKAPTSTLLFKGATDSVCAQSLPLSPEQTRANFQQGFAGSICVTDVFSYISEITARPPAVSADTFFPFGNGYVPAQRLIGAVVFVRGNALVLDDGTNLPFPKPARMEPTPAGVFGRFRTLCETMGLVCLTSGTSNVEDAKSSHDFIAVNPFALRGTPAASVTFNAKRQLVTIAMQKGMGFTLNTQDPEAGQKVTAMIVAAQRQEKPLNAVRLPTARAHVPARESVTRQLAAAASEPLVIA